MRTGRLDPGRRGAAALVCAALLASVVAGCLVVRGRPVEVVVPQVVASGVPLPGTADPGGVGAGAPGGKASGTTPGATEGPATKEVVVAVAGLVRRPGLVRLPAGSRVDDAVRAAGGPLTVSSTGLLNLARTLVDGEQVLVGVEPPPGTPAGPVGPAAAGAPPGPPALVDLNAATVAELDGLPGIGPVLAQRIVDWRSDNQRFASIDQLREVTGIGEATFEDLRTRVSV